MAKRKLDEDSRTAAERQADERALARFKAGEFLAVSKKRQAAAIRTVEAAAARREKAAMLGPEVAIIRRARGMSQEQLADTLGTQKSNISRFEKGRDGGLSIERFLGILEAVTGLSTETLSARSPRSVLINEPVFAQFSGPNDWLESA